MYYIEFVMPWDKEKEKQYKKEWYQNNKEKVIQRSKEWREENKEKDKQYQQSEKRKKSKRIGQWKFYGIITDDYDAL